MNLYHSLLIVAFYHIYLLSADALASLRAHIPPNAILVGQNILKDVQWLQLAEGVDYFQLIDISALFRVWNASRGEYTTFSQGKIRYFQHSRVRNKS